MIKKLKYQLLSWKVKRYIRKKRPIDMVLVAKRRYRKRQSSLSGFYDT